MGREVRQVPPNWEHPKNQYGTAYRPMFEDDYDEHITEWIKEQELWRAGKHPDQLSGIAGDKYYAQWAGNPPSVEYYNVYYTPEEATWFQLYETVSEGTPVSPPFATKQELAEYLAEHGDFWYQKSPGGWRAKPTLEAEHEDFWYQKSPGGWRAKPTLEQALSLVDAGGAFSFVAISSPNKPLEVFDVYQQQDLPR